MRRIGFVAAAAVATLLAPMLLAWASAARDGVAAPDVVLLTPEPFLYRAAGEFTRDGKPVGAPARTVTLDHPLAIMARQVTAAEYQHCVAERACPVDPEAGAAMDRPAIRVSWEDAQAYAAWLSRRTGVAYRLPTDEEWTFAADSHPVDEALPAGDGNPARLWLARYALEAERAGPVDRTPHPIGSFGINANGLSDVAGNVWEWTDSCFTRQSLDDAAARPIVNCGVRVVEGRHRTYMTDFIRDARTGGCSVGQPPSNLGFRLVRDATSGY